MFKIFLNAFKVKEIRNKIFFVLFIVLIYRIGCVIPLPGIDISNWLTVSGKMNTGFNLQSILGGGQGTIFSMGISPFITSSIVVQLLTVAIPRLEEIQKEGQDGREKIQQLTRIIAVALAVLQAGGMVYTLSQGQIVQTEAGIGMVNFFKQSSWFIYLLATSSLVAGTIFVMWLSEVLTEKGFGNGTSFIIFANILSGLPGQLIELFRTVTGRESGWAIKIVLLVLALVLFIAIMIFSVLIQDGERRIPVQYSKKMVGRQMVGGQSNVIPLKVNIAGVMSIIFAMSLMGFPGIINGFLNNETLTKIVSILDVNTNPTILGVIVYIILIFAFTFFYTSFAINPNEMAENIKKSGGFIPGIRPGKPTSDYITNTVGKLSWIGATFYSLIALAPLLVQMVLGVKVGFGGTTLLIVSSVALEIVKQLESLLLMRHYKGFLS